MKCNILPSFADGDKENHAFSAIFRNVVRCNGTIAKSFLRVPDYLMSQAYEKELFTEPGTGSSSISWVMSHCARISFHGFDMDMSDPERRCYVKYAVNSKNIRKDFSSGISEVEGAKKSRAVG